MNFNELIYWNINSYGNAKRINKHFLKSFILTLGVIIPVIIPLPLMVFLASKIKKDFIIRYN